MPRPKAKVESSLRAKGFEKQSGDHNYFICLIDCPLTQDEYENILYNQGLIQED